MALVEADVTAVETQIDAFLRANYEVPTVSAEDSAPTKSELLEQAAALLAKANAMPDEGMAQSELEALLAEAREQGKNDYKAAIAAL